MPIESLTFKEVLKGVSKADLWGGPKSLHAAITKFAAGTSEEVRQAGPWA